MASKIAATRLRKELANLKKDPPPGVIAEPKESDILTWFYALRGPPETPYEGGMYVGKLVFPSQYPMKPPSILMLTPSGRFQVNTRICMSMSDFHPESWNPMWSVASILQGVVSFMSSEELTTGGLKCPDGERKRLAGLSKQYNDKNFSHLFDGNMEAAFEEAETARRLAEKAAASASKSTSSSVGRRTRKVSGAQRKTEQTSGDDKQGDEKVNEKEEEEDEEDSSTPKELTPDEIEKRRKKNAQKRAKQKAKKAAEKAADNEP